MDTLSIKNFNKKPSKTKRLLYLEVTRKCNLKCPHCFNDSKIDCEKELSLEEIKKIIDNFLVMGGKEIQLTGGEVFMRKDIFEIMNYAKEKGIEYIRLSTNGTMVNEKNIIKIVELVDEIFFSIDGFEEQHDILRGKGAFQKTINIVDSLSLMDIKISVYLTLTPAVLEYLEEYIEWLIRKNVSHLNISPIGKVGRAKSIDRKFLFEKKEYYNIYTKIRKFQRKYANKITITQPLTFKLEDFNIENEPWVCNTEGNVGLLIGGDTSEKWTLCNAKEGFIFNEEKLLNYSNLVIEKIKAINKYSNSKTPIHWWEEITAALEEG